ncbi:MAG TPA: hypothetical protein DDZ81_05390 [Acetobacteraceae bacterium]|jgi:hypothetical protein|nr:hypothetical protein [Acetobacteraceae bacterium]
MIDWGAYIGFTTLDAASHGIGPDDRAAFPRQHLLRPKSLPRIASPQYGFVGAVAFSEEPLPPEA